MLGEYEAFAFKIAEIDNNNLLRFRTSFLKWKWHWQFGKTQSPTSTFLEMFGNTAASDGSQVIFNNPAILSVRAGFQDFLHRFKNAELLELRGESATNSHLLLHDVQSSAAARWGQELLWHNGLWEIICCGHSEASANIQKPAAFSSPWQFQPETNERARAIWKTVSVGERGL